MAKDDSSHGTLAVDPGAKTGWALFQGDLLVKCGTMPGIQAAQGPIAICSLAVIEAPRIRRRHPRPQDLITLALLTGQIAAHYPNHQLVPPEQWKGQMPKDVCWRRVLTRLLPTEMALVRTAGADWNCRDAVGLGLWALGRF